MTLADSGPAVPPSAPFGGATRALVIGCLFLIPLAILALGYLPRDDALRHAAKAVSGKPWHQILVLREDAVLDAHAGWHALLETVHRLTGTDVDGLLAFSVVTGFVALGLGPASVLRRPEAWLAALLALALTEPPVVIRLLTGRPFLVSAGVLTTLCIVWPALRARSTPWRTMGILAGLLALATWVHGTAWYLFGLPLAAFVLAREWRVAARFATCWTAGVLAAAVITGAPLAFLWLTAKWPFLVIVSAESPATLVYEVRPATHFPMLALPVAAVLAGRAVARRWSRAVVDQPVFLLGALGGGLGLVSARFWTDWGMPAVLVWLAIELQAPLEGRWTRGGITRLAVATLLGAVTVVTFAADRNGRWTVRDDTYTALTRPEAAALLPDPGGIVYGEEMRLFFQVFARKPQAPWRYVLGFEPGLMPPEDLAVYRGAYRRRAPRVFAPWVAKMKPADRLILRSAGGPPPIAALEWHHVSGDVWSGRRP